MVDRGTAGEGDIEEIVLWIIASSCGRGGGLRRCEESDGGEQLSMLS